MNKKEGTVMNKEPMYTILEENHLEGERSKFYVEIYATKKLAQEKMQEQIEECMQENEAEITDGELGNDYVELKDQQENVYIFKIQKEYVKGE